jgi:hypothetical protein
MSRWVKRGREAPVRLLAPGSPPGGGAGRAQGDPRPLLPADSVRDDTQGSAPFARRHGEGSAQSGGVERGNSRCLGPGGMRPPRAGGRATGRYCSHRLPGGDLSFADHLPHGGPDSEAGPISSTDFITSTALDIPFGPKPLPRWPLARNFLTENSCPVMTAQASDASPDGRR